MKVWVRSSPQLWQVADLINNSTVFPRLSNQMLYYTDIERGGELEKEDDKMERKNVETGTMG